MWRIAANRASRIAIRGDMRSRPETRSAQMRTRRYRCKAIDRPEIAA
jgi:hypothetical protein